MIVLGLTGSIGMGKSTAARALRRLGLPVFDADRTVRDLMGPGGAAVALVEAAFPGVVRDGAIDHAALAERVFGEPAALERLEDILHPLVRAAEARFLRRAAGRREPVVVLDIPLLFETGVDRFCDATILVTAPPFVQEARLRRREGMTGARLAAVRARQMAEPAKRRRADFVVPTGLDRGRTLNRLRRIVTLILAGRADAGGEGPGEGLPRDNAAGRPPPRGRGAWRGLAAMGARSRGGRTGWRERRGNARDSARHRDNRP